MTAAMLVLEPIFEADLPPEIYAYRAGRNAQELLFRGHPDVVDADLADYLEAASYCPPAYEVTSFAADRRGEAPRLAHVSSLRRQWIAGHELVTARVCRPQRE